MGIGESIMIEILLWLMIKHFICDFPLQAHPYLYRHKHEYGHLGGILHALIHGVGTAIVLLFFPSVSLELMAFIMILDVVIHYHIDYCKMKIGKIYNLKPDNSEAFWSLLGFDQLLHFLTYYFIVTEIL